MSGCSVRTNSATRHSGNPASTRSSQSSAIMSVGLADDLEPSISQSMIFCNTAVFICARRNHGKNGSMTALLWKRPLLPDLSAMPEELICQHAGHHGFADWHGADADAGIVAAFGDDFGVGAAAIDGAARREDGRCRLHRKPRDQRLPGGDATKYSSSMIGQEADALVAHPHLVGVFLAG